MSKARNLKRKVKKPLKKQRAKIRTRCKAECKPLQKKCRSSIQRLSINRVNKITFMKGTCPKLGMTCRKKCGKTFRGKLRKGGKREKRLLAEIGEQVGSAVGTMIGTAVPLPDPEWEKLWRRELGELFKGIGQSVDRTLLPSIQEGISRIVSEFIARLGPTRGPGGGTPTGLTVPPTGPPMYPPIGPPMGPPVPPMGPPVPPIEPPTVPPIEPPTVPPIEPPIEPPTEPPTEPPIVPGGEPTTGGTDEFTPGGTGGGEGPHPVDPLPPADPGNNSVGNNSASASRKRRNMIKSNSKNVSNIYKCSCRKEGAQNRSKRMIGGRKGKLVKYQKTMEHLQGRKFRSPKERRLAGKELVERKMKEKKAKIRQKKAKPKKQKRYKSQECQPRSGVNRKSRRIGLNSRRIVNRGKIHKQSGRKRMGQQNERKKTNKKTKKQKGGIPRGHNHSKRSQPKQEVDKPRRKVKLNTRRDTRKIEFRRRRNARKGGQDKWDRKADKRTQQRFVKGKLISWFDRGKLAKFCKRVCCAKRNGKKILIAKTNTGKKRRRKGIQRK